ncbi:hypothetical protein [Sulfurovum sp.]|uniref:capsular polysaccharide export protein, LipB/KpsS family n=1 Tax=Sulfurovum sp. TaxID=1969726 RepID=UPI003563AFF4
MKIVFIENMYRTYFWERIADRLKLAGHEIGWIVQNHVYRPQTNENIHIVPYPTKKNRKENSLHLKSFSYIRSTDRIINFFDGTDDHYSYYYEKFSEAINDLKPDLVIGESTLFHEIMIIDICKTKNIPFLHPASTSYPSGRFSFYYNDTKVPFQGETLAFDEELYDNLVDSIGKRKIVPDYMKKPVVPTNKYNYPKHKSIQDKSMRLQAYFSGEKYNTPSPLRKIKKDKEVQILLKEWDLLATSLNTINDSKKILLYPFQLQPEANLDVWGNAHRDQVKLVQEMANVIPKDWVIVVKTNPKSKYEMSEELISLIGEQDNIIALDRNVPMSDIFNLSNIVVTVTGTIAIECVLANKPLGLLGVSMVNESTGCLNMLNAQEVVELITTLENGTFINANQEAKRNIIHRMMTTSYPGLISDPVSNPNCVNEDNLNLVCEGFLEVMKRIETYEN